MALVTREAVFSAADALTEAGIRPTLQKVRDEVGGGSFSTLSKFMEEYRAEQQAKAVPMKEPAPDAMRDKLDGFLSELWASAMSMANARLATEREAMDVARNELERAQGEALELADQVSLENEQLQSKILEQAEMVKAFELKVQQLVASEMALKQQLAKAENDKEKVQIRLEETEKRLADHQLQIKDLKSEHNAAITKITAESDRLAKENNAKLNSVQDKLMASQSKSDSLLQERNNLAGELSNLKQALVQSADTITRLTSEAISAQERASKLETELNVANQEKTVALEKAANLAGQLQASTKTNKQTKT